MPYISDRASNHGITENVDCEIIWDTKNRILPNIQWIHEVSSNGCLLYLPTGAQGWSDIHRKDFPICTTDEIFTAMRKSRSPNFFFFENRNDIMAYFDDLKTEFDLHHLNASNQIWFIIQGVHQMRMETKSLRTDFFRRRNFQWYVWALNNIFNKRSFGRVLNYALKEKVLRYLFFFCGDELEPSGAFRGPKSLFKKIDYSKK